MKKVILASTSPRRKELLGKTGLVFECVAPEYEEDMTLPLPPHELVQHLSRGKAESVAKRMYPDTVIIGADTFVVFENQVLGKPHTPERAKEMLHLLSGKTHTILTGFTIIDTQSSRSVSKAVEAKVHFKKLTDEEINSYIKTGEPLDRAGAYAVQGLGSELVDKIEGDYSSVVGLPVEEVLLALADFGINP